MNKVVLGMLMTVFLFTAVPVHAQVAIPTDREAIIALIQVLLKRIDEIKTEMAEKERSEKRADQAAERKAKAEADAKKQYEKELADMKERYLKVQEHIIQFETLGASYLEEYASGSDAKGITLNQVQQLRSDARYEMSKTILASLKVEKLRLDDVLKQHNAN